MRKILLALFAIASLCVSLNAQNTVGLLQYNDPLSQDGYNLFYPFNQSTVYLTDNCGRIVNEWPDSLNFRAGVGTHLTNSGMLLRCKRDISVAGDPIWAGGGGEIVELLDWDGTLRWSLTMADSMRRLHHDALMLPNGNVLMLAWEKKTGAETIAAGRDTSLLASGELWPDFLLEVTPILDTDSFTVVWEWHAWDHLIQDYDSSKSNYGVVGDHPELIDINIDGNMPVPADWMHVNAINYNAETDQIILSLPAFNELFIIDHSTSTSQAAGHTGGLSGKGGDLMWRWGNPGNYDAPGAQQLFFQHDAHWMDIGLPVGHPDRSKILLFNNRIGPNYSHVNVLAPVFDTYEWEYLKDTTAGTFYPSTFEWTYEAPVPTDFYSVQISAAQRLPNGNTMIFSGMQGWGFEITPAKNIVWEYVLPFNNGSIMSQGDSVVPGSNPAFVLKRYMPSFPGFTGITLLPGDYIELNPDTTVCASGVWVSTPKMQGQVTLAPNPAQDRLVIGLDGFTAAVAVFMDGTGRAVKQITLSGQLTEADIADLPNGLYLVMLDGKRAGKLVISR